MATTDELKVELNKTVDALRTLRDEVRVKLHLAGLEAKAEWEKLEPHIDNVEKKASELTQASHTAATEALKKLQSFRASLK